MNDLLAVSDLEGPRTAVMVTSSRAGSTDSPSIARNATTAHQDEHVKPAVLISQLFLASLTCNGCTGLTVIAITKIAEDLAIDMSLVDWPVLVFPLVSGSLLLVAGSVADIIGRGSINLLGQLVLAVCTISCGLSKNVGQLIAFRALAGVGLAMFLPTSIGLLSKHIPAGKMRNLGYSLIGVGQILGYGCGLVLGGILTSTIAGWRTGFYIVGSLSVALLLTAFYIFPVQRRPPIKLLIRLDWTGIVLLSASLAMLSYVLAKVSYDSSNMASTGIIVLIVLGISLIPACVIWFHWREATGKPVLLRNSIWSQPGFAAISIMTMLAYASMATMELLASLFYQNVQELSPLQSAIHILPSLVSGGILNLSIGLWIHGLPPLVLVLASGILSAVSPLLMALTNPVWPYWITEFSAQLLYPLCADVLFTVALLIVSETFPEEEQAFAGAVFSTVGQIGESIGLATVGVVSNLVTKAHESSSNPLLDGYRAGFWTVLAWIILVCIVGTFGLSSVQRLGVRRE